PVHDARIGPPTVAQLQVVKDAAPERVPLPLLGRNRQESRGLVDDDDVGVLVEDGESRSDGPLRGPAAAALDPCRLRDLPSGAGGGPAVAAHAPGAHGLARPAPRQPETSRALEVEPHRGVLAAVDSARGTRISTKNPGSPIRAPSRAPGP